jgi:hypothetical protein
VTEAKTKPKLNLHFMVQFNVYIREGGRHYRALENAKTHKHQIQQTQNQPANQNSHTKPRTTFSIGKVFSKVITSKTAKRKELM